MENNAKADDACLALLEAFLVEEAKLNAELTFTSGLPGPEAIAKAMAQGTGPKEAKVAPRGSQGPS